MDLLQKLKAFLASTLVAFAIRICPEIEQQRSAAAPSLPQPENPVDIESAQSQRSPSPSSASPSAGYESRQAQLPLPAPNPTTPSNLKLQLQESLLAAQHHLQWQNSVLAFCFSYALGVSLQFVGNDQSNHRLPVSMVLLSFLVLFTFIFILGAFFIHPNSTRTSQAMEKIGFLLAAAAFCHTLSIPFSLELKCAIWAVFILSLLIAMFFAYLHLKTARC